MYFFLLHNSLHAVLWFLSLFLWPATWTKGALSGGSYSASQLFRCIATPSLTTGVKWNIPPGLMSHHIFQIYFSDILLTLQSHMWTWEQLLLSFRELNYPPGFKLAMALWLIHSLNFRCNTVPSEGLFFYSFGLLSGSVVKYLSANARNSGLIPEEDMATSILAWRQSHGQRSLASCIPWDCRVGQYWATDTHACFYSSEHTADF